MKKLHKYLFGIAICTLLLALHVACEDDNPQEDLKQHQQERVALQIRFLNVGDTIKASHALVYKAIVEVKAFSDGLSNVQYYEHKQSGDSVLLKNIDVQDTAYSESYIFAINANTVGFSALATNEAGKAAYLYKPAYSPFHIVVAQDSSGTHTTLKEAFAAIPSRSNNPTVILIKNGTYKEWLIIESSKTNVILVGENVDSTIITYDAAASQICPAGAPKCTEGEGIGTMGTATLHVEAENFYAENLTFENTAGENAGQAVALRTTKDKMVFVNCKLLGHQDTHYTHGSGRQYYKNCYIAGTTDFIFGGGVIFFDSCLIYCRTQRGNVITAASGAPNGRYNYVFSNCRVEGAAGSANCHLGRPWQDGCKVAFINTYMSERIEPVGWRTWGTKNYNYYEYGSYGPGANNTATRGNNAIDKGTFKFLTDAEVRQYTLEAVMMRQDIAPPQIIDSWHPNLLINRAENILRR